MFANFCVSLEAAVALLMYSGPPGEPAGARVPDGSIGTTSVQLTWWPSYDNGRTVLYYIVEIFNNYEKYWKRPNATG